MSLDPKSIHLRLPPDMYERAVILSGLENRDVAAYMAILAEKMIVAEWHSVTLQAERMHRLGLTGIRREG
jgi:hypothetical protein